MLELNLSQLQCHPDACDATLVPASYCEPTLRHVGSHCAEMTHKTYIMVKTDAMTKLDPCGYFQFL